MNNARRNFGENILIMEILVMADNNFISAKQAALKKYFSRMNDMQQEAVFAVNGPVLVLAGAGSGEQAAVRQLLSSTVSLT